MDAALNPLLIDDDTPLALPDFSRIRSTDFAPALKQAMAQIGRASCRERVYSSV